MESGTGPPITPTYLRDDLTFLDHYFASVYNKLEADALLFNRQLPHAGLVGAENELALAALLRDFLPPRFGIEVSGIVIDRHGGQSRQCDIVIYDAQTFPKYLRKVFPVEIVYAIIEVKTSIGSTEAKAARDVLDSVFALDFPASLTPNLERQIEEGKILADPPAGVVFAYRSSAIAFETFADWFPFEMVLDGQRLYNTGRGPEIRTILVTCLDKGYISIGSTNLYVERRIPTAYKNAAARSFRSTLAGKTVLVDPAKTLFMFLEHLWHYLLDAKLHPGFDIASYLTVPMMSSLPAGGVAEMPSDWYMKLETERPSETEER